MKIHIYRGAHQIGGSCIEISTSLARIILDVGDELPEENFNKSKRRIIPQVPNLFLSSTESRQAIDAVFISHMHSDHIGLIDQIKTDIPIYIGKYALAIWETIQEFTNQPKVSNPTRYLSNGEPIVINYITVTPFIIDHSAFDAYSFLIENEGERIFYTGDFRNHGFAQNYTFAIQNNPILKNIDTLLIEGTNLYKDEYVAETESDLSMRAKEIMENTVGNVFVLQSSTNIARIQAIYNATKATNRILLVDIFTANILQKLPRKIPNPFSFDDVYLFYPMVLTEKTINEKPHLFYPFGKYKITTKELYNRKDLVILIRESMVQEIKNRIQTDNSCLIYSKWKGYMDESKTANLLGYFDDIVELHTSGHADIPSIKEFVKSINPNKIIPIHTTTPEKYIELFGNKVKLYEK